MAEFPEVIDREVQFPVRARLVETPEEGVYDLVSTPGEVTHEGTDIGNDFFKALKDYIDGSDREQYPIGAVVRSAVPVDPSQTRGGQWKLREGHWFSGDYFYERIG